MSAARLLALAVLLAACGPSGPTDEVRAAACDYVQSTSDANFASRELAAYQLAAGGDFDDFVALGPERQARFEGLLDNVRTVEPFEPMSATASTTAQAIEEQIAAGEALVDAPSEAALATLAETFGAFGDAERQFLADLSDHVPEPCA